MRKTTMAATAALLCSGLAMSGAQAAGTQASMDQCRALATQVSQALASNQQSQNYNDADKARRSGQDFCVHGLYQPGVANYQTALKLLGADVAKRSDSVPGA